MEQLRSERLAELSHEAVPLSAALRHSHSHSSSHKGTTLTKMNCHEFVQNTAAINAFGDSAWLTADPERPIVVANLRIAGANGDGRSTPQALPIDPNQRDALLDCCNIAFNVAGNALLAWSTTKVVVVLIPAQLLRDGCLSIENGASSRGSGSGSSCGNDGADGWCRVQVLASDYLVDIHANADSPRVVKAAFHRSSPNHVVILREQGSLLLVDIVTDVIQDFKLPIGTPFVSFAFGPEIDWLYFSILLLAKSGQLYVLCPIVPHGAAVPKSRLDDVWNWIREQPRTPENHAYLDEVISFGFEALGSPCSNDYLHQHSRASVPLIRLPQDPLDWLVKLAQLQGPIQLTRMDNGASVTNSSSGCYTDLTTLAAPDSFGVPIVAMVNSHGAVEIMLLNSNEKLYNSYVTPAWSEAQSELSSIHGSIVEKVALPVQSAAREGGAFWQIIADPVHAHYLHLYNAGGDGNCEVYLVSSPWVQTSVQEYRAFIQFEEGFGDASIEEESPTFKSSEVLKVYHKSDPTQESSVSAYVVQCDPVLGHFALFRSSSGALGQLDVSGFKKLHDIEASAHSVDKLSHHNIDSHRSRANDMIFDRLLKAVKDSVNDVPKPAESFKFDATEIQCIESLKSASQYIGDKVLLPLEELEQRALFRTETIDSLQLLQTQILEGDAALGIEGLKTQLINASKAQDNLKLRLEQLLIDNKSQRERADRLYQAVLRSKLVDSPYTRHFRQELASWRQQLITMEKLLMDLQQRAALEALNQRRAAASLSNSTLPKSPFSPVAQSPFAGPKHSPAPLFATPATPTAMPTPASASASVSASASSGAGFGSPTFSPLSISNLQPSKRSYRPKLQR